MSVTFSLTVLAWVIFRAENISHAISYLSEIFSPSLFTFPQILPIDLLIIIVIFLMIEWFNREKQFALNFSINENKKWLTIIKRIELLKFQQILS